MAAMALAHDGIIGLSNQTSARPLIFAVILVAVAILLTAGLWTAIAGVLVAVMQLWSGYLRPGDFWFHILLGTLGIALALLGPGAWSVDARLFGWKRIDIRDRKS
jgi:hypothetical protein